MSADLRLIEGDCLAVLETLPDHSVDSIVCDPPYGLSFMGRDWDQNGVPGVPFWSEMLRVAKPGTYLLAFGGTRTVHRLACAIEDAGWEIRDTLVWAYAQGFPKSHNLAGERKGWGTALKPAWEPIVMARKPLIGTVAANVLRYGTGALNIDGCRIGFTGEADERESKDKNRHADFGTEPGGNTVYGDFSMVPRTNYDAPGRWPANVILTDAVFDGDCPDGVVGGGTSKGGAYPTQRSAAVATGFGVGQPTDGGARQMGDAGGKSRFFLLPKASRRDRDSGVNGEIGLPVADIVTFATENGTSGRPSSLSEGRNTKRRNTHPTVKPTELMRHLVRLVTPPGGLVLDPFAGSGSTGVACAAEGMRFLGIEREPEYATIARARLGIEVAA